jgi:hypothetical protein
MSNVDAFYDRWIEDEVGKDVPLLIEQIFEAAKSSDLFFHLERDWLTNYFNNAMKNPWLQYDRKSKTMDVQLSSSDHDIYVTFPIDRLFIDHFEDFDEEGRRVAIEKLHELANKLEKTI